jgi:hypothetical protein
MSLRTELGLPRSSRRDDVAPRVVVALAGYLPWHMCDEDVARRVHEELAGRAADEVLRKPAAAVGPQREEVRPEALDGVTDDVRSGTLNQLQLQRRWTGLLAFEALGDMLLQ